MWVPQEWRAYEHVQVPLALSNNAGQLNVTGGIGNNRTNSDQVSPLDVTYAERRALCAHTVLFKRKSSASTE